MNQPAAMKPKPRRQFNWPDAPRRFRLPKRQCALLLALALLCACYIGPLSDHSTQVAARRRVLPVYSVEREDDVVSISFDASWGGEQTLGILDVLDEYDVKATFFLVGIWVEKYPELVKETAND